MQDEHRSQFKLWCWRGLLSVARTSRRSNQSILKEINPEYSLEGLMLKVKLQYFGHLIQRVDSLEKTLMLGKIEGQRRSGWQRMRWFGQHHQLNGHESEQTPGDGGGQGSLVCRSSWGRKELDVTQSLNSNIAQIPGTGRNTPERRCSMAICRHGGFLPPEKEGGNAMVMIGSCLFLFQLCKIILKLKILKTHKIKYSSWKNGTDDN